MSEYVTKHIDIIPKEIRNKISNRYHVVTKAINSEFWNSSSDTAHSLYVGSYGRRTAISTSDIDILVVLPKSEYQRHDYAKGNGQSRLLQSVRTAILTAYPRSNVRADGQVVKIDFSDGMKFEILPAFMETDYFGRNTGNYTYPDTNMGGNWKSTNPKIEQEAMINKNKNSNGLLIATCRHIRNIKSKYFSSYTLSGIVIDAFVYEAIGSWKFTDPGEISSVAAGSYEHRLLDYFLSIHWSNTITAPGSSQIIDITSSKDCLEKVLRKII